jgi:hypothetical protein
MCCKRSTSRGPLPPLSGRVKALCPRFLSPDIRQSLIEPAAIGEEREERNRRDDEAKPVPGGRRLPKEKREGHPAERARNQPPPEERERGGDEDRPEDDALEQRRSRAPEAERPREHLSRRIGEHKPRDPDAQGLAAEALHEQPRRILTELSKPFEHAAMIA